MFQEVVEMRSTAVENDKESLRGFLLKCFFVEVRWIGGRATNMGRTDYLDIVAIDKNGNSYFLNVLYSSVFGYRLSKDDFIIMSGCGFSKSHHVAMDLFRLIGREPGCSADVNVNPKIVYR